MKSFNTLLVLLIVSISLFWSCRGEDGLPGPQGPPGYDGEDGGIVLALMYEFEFDLNQANDWQVTYRFPSADEIYQEDVVLVYLLWDVVDNKDVWRLMPVSFLNDQGIQMINYDFTVDDVRIFLESQYPMSSSTEYPNEIARVVIIPADYSPNARKATVDYSDYEAVKAAYNLKDGNTALKGTPLKETLIRLGAEIK